jgi:hypothetical protein
MNISSMLLSQLPLQSLLPALMPLRSFSIVDPIDIAVAVAVTIVIAIAMSVAVAR